MKTLMVVGLGSMGKRRLRLLKMICSNLHLCGVDGDECRRHTVKEDFDIPTYADINQAIQNEKPEAAIVSTPPLTHASIIKICLEKNLHVFSELNLVADGYEENIALANSMHRTLFLSSTFLYRKEVGYIIEQVKRHNGFLNYRYHIGQYLPDWHPWEEYTKCFFSDNRTNGCRELFAIELPWLCAAFGPIASVQVIHRKQSNLCIDYDDSFMILVSHSTGHIGSLCVDVVSRRAVRQFELYGENLYLTWDGQPDSLHMWDIKKEMATQVALYEKVDHQEKYADFIVENAYMEELNTFIGQISGKGKSAYGFEDDLRTLQWIDYIEGK